MFVHHLASGMASFLALEDDDEAVPAQGEAGEAAEDCVPLTILSERDRFM
jgi:hypothetical protein